MRRRSPSITGILAHDPIQKAPPLGGEALGNVAGWQFDCVFVEEKLHNSIKNRDMN